jgi:hypothetical protein
MTKCPSGAKSGAQGCAPHTAACGSSAASPGPASLGACAPGGGCSWLVVGCSRPGGAPRCRRLGRTCLVCWFCFAGAQDPPAAGGSLAPPPASGPWAGAPVSFRHQGGSCWSFPTPRAAGDGRVPGTECGQGAAGPGGAFFGAPRAMGFQMGPKSLYTGTRRYLPQWASSAEQERGDWTCRCIEEEWRQRPERGLRATGARAEETSASQMVLTIPLRGHAHAA